MEKVSKIYIAGDRGMVGSAIMRRLRAEGYENIITQSHSELDLTRQADVEEYFRSNRPEYVFLAAAKVGGILANNTYKAEFIYENIMIAANIIHSAYKYDVKKLLNLGSSCIYPKLAIQPMKEDYLLSGSLEPTNEPYAIAKISALKLCRYYNDQYGTNYISVMPTNLYGPNDNFNLETAHVLPALLRKLHLARLLKKRDFKQIRRDLQKYPLGFNIINQGIPESETIIKSILERVGITDEHVIVWGAGEAYREFLHADDLADACVFLIANCDYNDLGEFINIGTGEDIQVKDLVKLLCEEIGYTGEIRFDTSKPDGTLRKLLDVSKIEAMNWSAKMKLRDGIRSTYDWYRSSFHE